ncbi:hypothetical protein KQH90_02410 [Anaerosalibacter bizertensis]|uniref:hypothetical protein n=1 Tax=Anaerosalibacter bizertensis TaxID=932217 RepID=UPI001C0E95BC|nr:hypothetical protein [Anaerosalibacter bizertensis]MBU5292891.1 hypothetical protein [Anaerosalibacter bizertensis]
MTDDTKKTGILGNILSDCNDDTSLLFFFLLLVVIFCNCDYGYEDSNDSLLFFFLLLVILFCNCDNTCGC